ASKPAPTLDLCLPHNPWIVGGFKVCGFSASLFGQNERCATRLGWLRFLHLFPMFLRLSCAFPI
ncbi:hypothetical protein, partial [Pseudomonas tehranensis]|uniref:hypothetical protein n=1 Tax=Pseudomonas tehranensis TaxID=2745502 RepID=UPI001CD85680